MNKIDKVIENTEEVIKIVFSGFYPEKYGEKISEFILSKRDHEHGFLGFYMEPYFANINPDEIHKKTDEMLYWCIVNKVPIETLAIMFINIYLAERKTLDKLMIDLSKDKRKELKEFNESMKDFVEVIQKDNYFSFLDEEKEKYAFNMMNENIISSLKHILDESNLKFPPQLFKHLLNNSFNVAYENVKNKLSNLSLPLSQYTIDKNTILSEIEKHKKEILDICDNPKQFVQINKHLHFLNPLYSDDWVKSYDGRYVFENYTKGLTVGYTNKAILISVDKNIAIRELQTKIKHLKDYKTEESEKLIAYTNILIQFIKQKRYANHVPFKALSKELGITKSQAKNYAKKLFSINDKSFFNNFENIKLLDQ